MANIKGERGLYKVLVLSLLSTSLYACSQKAPTVGTIRSGSESGAEAADKDVVEKGSSIDGRIKTGTTEIARADTTQKDPVNTGASDEAITPPVAQTGSPTSGKPNDPNQKILNGFYFIKAAGSLKCLALPQDSRASGVQLEQRLCDKNSNVMKFEIEYKAAENAYIISNIASQKFLEIRDQNEVPLGAIQQGDYFALQHQMFSIEVKEPNRYHIRTKSKQLFIDVAGASADDGALIQLWGDGNGISSVWILEPTL